MMNEWTLMLLTAFVCLGAGLFSAVAAGEKLGLPVPVLRNGAAFALLTFLLGALSGILNLGHPTMIIGTLAHPFSPIFQQTILTGCTVLLLTVYLAAVIENVSQSVCRRLAYTGALCSGALVFALGSGYVMPWRAVWNTWTLPLPFIGFLLANAVAGTVLFTAFQRNSQEQSPRFIPLGQFALAVCVSLYPLALAISQSQEAREAFVRLMTGDFALIFWGPVVGVGIITPCIVSVLPQLKTAVRALIALLCLFTGSAAFQLIIWHLGASQWHFFEY